jgi:CO/xanthine dehydrogenase FAD-binding subunit
MNRKVKYFAPASINEAIRLLAESGDKVNVLAGGTDLAPMINRYELQPEVILYIGNLELDYIKEVAGTIVIGTCVTLAQILESELLKEKADVLVQAASDSSSTAIRTTATIGGNIMNASPAGDMIPPLFVLDAQLVLISQCGERTVSIKEFFTGPGTTVRKPDELLKEIRIPAGEGKCAFVKLGKRKAQVLSVVSCAARVVQQNGLIKEVHLALGSVAPTVVCESKAAHGMLGKPFSAELASDAAQAAMNMVKPIDDARATAWYRKTAGVAVVKKAIFAAAGVEYSE